MLKKLFIDGHTGTTAQKIKTVLAPFVEAGAVEVIEAADHRNIDQRMTSIASADLAVLCTHDDISRGTMTALRERGIATRILDTSSAFRTDPGWTYGFPELSAGQAEKIANASYVANPGCYATGAVAVLRPLVDAGFIVPSAVVEITGFSGFSGGGKDMVTTYETASPDQGLAQAILFYSLSSPHKHLPEIAQYSGLTYTPNFFPQVVPVPCGMMVRVSFNEVVLPHSMADVHKVYAAAYGSNPGSAIRVAVLEPTLSRIDFSDFLTVNRDFPKHPPDEGLKIHVTGWEQGTRRQVTVMATLDNLGKGAASQAVQNVRLMLGF